MTTAQQRRLYFPAWQAAAKNHGWGRIGASPVRAGASPARVDFFGTPELNALYQRICQIASARAQARPSNSAIRNPQSAIPDDYRHACHIVAFGKDQSSSSLSNKQLDRILALFRLLSDPDDLAATLAWNNPSESARTRLLWWLRNQCIESYIVALSRERFHTDNWEALDYDDLRMLHLTLKNRPAAHKSVVGRTGASPVRAGAPPARERPASDFVNVARETAPEQVEEPF